MTSSAKNPDDDSNVETSAKNPDDDSNVETLYREAPLGVIERLEIRDFDERVNVEPRQEKLDRTAKAIAFSITMVFVLSLGFPLLQWFFRGDVPHEMVDFSKHAAAMASTLLGAILGFYFSSRRLR